MMSNHLILDGVFSDGDWLPSVRQISVFVGTAGEKMNDRYC